MRISAFSFVRDAVRLDYPIRQVVASLLPLVDEFVIAVGPSDDGTVEEIRSIGDARVRILETEWDPSHFVRGKINAVQTNLAMDECTGDWGFYLQADEVVHEEDLPVIRAAMERWLDDDEVEGFLFDYLHFWGDFDHVQWTRNWYRHEIRVVRLGRGIRSWKSAQGFRREGKKLRRRHPDGGNLPFDYGPFDHLRKFTDTHPEVMRDWIGAKNWQAGDYARAETRHEHNRLRARMITWLQDCLLRRQIGVYKNYVLIGPA